MCILCQTLSKLLVTDVCNTILLFFCTKHFCYYLIIILLCVGLIIPSQVHCSPPLPFRASLILGFEYPGLELEWKLCLFPHPCSMYSLSLLSSSLRKMPSASSDALWSRRGGKESIASVRKSSEGEV